MTSLSYEATIRLEKELQQFSEKIGNKESKLSQLIANQESQKKAQAFQINWLCNSALNIGFIICLATLLI